MGRGAWWALTPGCPHTYSLAQSVLARNAGLVAPLGSRSTSDCHIYDFARTNLTLTVSLGATADSQPALVRLSLAMGTLLQPVPGGCCTTCITNPVDPTLTVAPTTDSSTIEFLQARLVRTQALCSA